jgi:LytR cell envelope-related transcriptional attenuator
MSDESAVHDQPSYVRKSSNKTRLISSFFVVLVLIIIAMGALFMIGSSPKQKVVPPTQLFPTATIPPSPSEASISATTSITPSSTKSATTTLRVRVLNGSGMQGAASEIAQAFRTAGFAQVTTGNAPAFTYTGVTVSIAKKEYEKQVQTILNSVESSQSATITVNPTMPADIEVIVGR